MTETNLCKNKIIQLERLVDGEKGSLIDAMPLVSGIYMVYEIRKNNEHVEEAVLLRRTYGEDREVEVISVEGKRLTVKWINRGESEFNNYDKFLGEYGE